MRSNLRGWTLSCALLGACADPKVEKEKKEAEARARISAESTLAAAVPAPVNGRWSQAQLVKALVNAGLAPQHLDGAKGMPYMGAPAAVYQVGVATLYAFLYADSAARRGVVAKLDPATLAPEGTDSPYGRPRELVQNNNLVAIVVGGTDRQRERVTLAIAAGPPPP